MKPKSTLAKTVAKSAQWFLKTFKNGGTSFPGSLALKIDPHILDNLAKDYEIIVVTGTNGKTLTTALIVKILKEKYTHVLTNPTGANMLQGIVSAFLSAKAKKKEKKFAVLEIDEASLTKVCTFIEPKMFVFTNIFRDQMDRYGEIYTTYDYLIKGAAKSPDAVILANGDSPLFHSREVVNPQKFYGFQHKADHEQLAHYNTEGVVCPKCHRILHYKMMTYANLGNYFCPHCAFCRPALDYTLTHLTELTHTSSSFIIDEIPIHIEVGGMYNIYNALAATAVGEYYGISKEAIQKGLAYDEKVFGRQETFEIKDKKCTLVLVKNPVGTNQVLEMMQLVPYEFTLVSLLNANYADGIDTSWIWDANYEWLTQMNIPKAIVAGVRHEEMARRLRVAGISREKIVEVGEDFERLIKEIQHAPTKHVYILATYTAVLELRAFLATKGYIKGGMEK